MLYNYLKIGIRNLLRHKVFSLINIFGLALGMTCSLLILLWAKNELSYNRFHQDSHLLFRVLENQFYPGGEDLTTESTPSKLADALKQEVPEITHVAKITWPVQELLAANNKVFKEEGHFVGPEFLEMFTFPLIAGNDRTALDQPGSIVISEKLAQKYFGTTQAVGQVFKVNNEYSYRVTGVCRNVPDNSSLQFDFLMPVKDFEDKPGNEWLQSWGNNGLRTYLKLRPGADVTSVNARIKNLIKKHEPESLTELFLQPVEDMHLHSDFRKGKHGGGRIEFVRIFGLVAVFILVIACINFINLSTARSGKRAREVGVRKVIGASRAALVGQFLGESVLVALLAALVAVNLAQALLPAFNDLLQRELVIDHGDPIFWLMLLGITVFTGALAGSYPAFFLSSFQPAAVLKGPLKTSSKAALFRKGLVVFQFMLSVIFISGKLVVYKQIHYLKNRDIGLDRHNVVYVPLEGDLRTHYKTFKAQLLQNPVFVSVSAANQNPLKVGTSTGGIDWKGKDPDASVLFSVVRADYDFLETMGINLKDGRSFSRQFPTDSTGFIVNEEAARLMQMRQPVGQEINWDTTGRIIGLMQNFHSTSMRMSMQPLIIGYGGNNASFAFIRLKPGTTPDALAALEKLVKRFNPAYPFEYHFLDEDFEKMYRDETVFGQLATYFSIIAIVISLLGLFGLALFTAEQRTKEIGIRKVMGASVTDIVAMLSKDFLKLVLLANLLALPLSWYLMRNWLRDFAFHTEISWWIFALACLNTVIIALLTVSFQAVRTALANPVNSLRSE